MIYESVELSHSKCLRNSKLRAIAQEHHLDKIRMTHRLMDGNLFYNINKSIKDDKIDMVMGTEGALDGQSFLNAYG
jgi:hypothetical protein